MMEKKHEKNGRRIQNDEQVMILDSFDGAEHLRSKKSISSVISFSSTMFCPSWINDKLITAGSSLNILTWQQIQGTETLYTMLPSVEEYYTSKKMLRNNSSGTTRSNYRYYDIHDGKMLYLLTQHSLWNRKFHPFLLCTCTRGAGVISDTHVCIPLTHLEQIESWERSKRRWINKKKQMESQGKCYKTKTHAAWVDENNKGVSHFGLHPNLLPRHDIRFDTFHMKCAVTRKLMTHLRNFILDQSNDVIELFQTKVLRKFWNDFHLYVWKNKKNFASFQGNELALFVGNSDIIVTFFDSHMESTTPLVKDITEYLKLWLSIFRFLRITYIEEGGENEYMNRIQTFNTELKLFYSIGRRTFLSAPGTTTGTNETFYLHTLRYYMPVIVRDTFDRHGTGVGVFTMQGFERRNKESKNCMKRFSSTRGNAMINNIKRVWDIFEYDVNAY